MEDALDRVGWSGFNFQPRQDGAPDPLGDDFGTDVPNDQDDQRDHELIDHDRGVIDRKQLLVPEDIRLLFDRGQQVLIRRWRRCGGHLDGLGGLVSGQLDDGIVLEHGRLYADPSRFP